MITKRFTMLLGTNKAFFCLAAFIGVIYCAVSVIVPAVSGDVVNAALDDIFSSGRLLFTYLMLSLGQILLAAADSWLGDTFKLRQKRVMRTASAETFMRRSDAGKDEISGFTSFLNNDIPSIVEQYFYAVIDAVKCISLIAFSALTLFRIDWVFAITIVGISVLIVVVPQAMRKRSGRVREKYSHELADYNTTLQSLLNGLKVLHAYGYRARANKRLEEKNSNVASGEAALVRRRTAIYTSTAVLQTANTVLILVVGVAFIAAGRIDVGGLLAVIQITELLGSPVEVLSHLQHGRIESAPLLKRYEELISEKQHIAANGFKPPVRNIEVKNLSYEVDGIEILHNVSVTFNAGGKYLLTGPSGSGKSTLLRLIAGIGDLSFSGYITCNGEEAANIPRNLYYKSICPVFQEPYLFHEDLEENILMGRNIPKERYYEIVEKLNLKYLLERYREEKITPEIVETLSGGERQRIALARAMVGSPEVYLLDEVTSSLDRENSEIVENALLRENAMVIHVCHKPDPRLAADYSVRYTLLEGKLVLSPPTM